METEDRMILRSSSVTFIGSVRFTASLGDVQPQGVAIARVSEKLEFFNLLTRLTSASLTTPFTPAQPLAGITFPATPLRPFQFAIKLLC